MENANENNELNALTDWCETIDAHWQKSKKSFSKLFDLKSLEEWETNLQSLKKQLKSVKRSQPIEEIYRKANELYHQWEIFHHESQSYRPKVDDDDGERKIGFLSFDEPTQSSVPPGRHRLPPLPYRYNALEPYIAEEIMKLHHTKHHQSYVDGLNKAEQEMEKARKTGDFALIKHWEREAAFHGAGHYLHTIFWTIMSPHGGGKPKGELAKMIETSFGHFEAFKHHFSEAAKQVEAVGWALLVWAPRSHRLEILQAEKHQHLSQWDVIPLLVLDVWEHAYYLQYKNERAKYVENWWHVVDWNEVEKRYKEAKKVKWKPY